MEEKRTAKWISIGEFEKFLEDYLATAMKDPDIKGFKAEVRVKSTGIYRVLTPVYVSDSGDHVFPVIYTERFYLNYRKFCLQEKTSEEKACALEKALIEIVSFIEMNKAPEEMLESVTMIYKDFDTAKSRLAVQLINPERNREYLKNIPYCSCLGDLTMIAMLVIGNDSSGMKRAVVTDSMLEGWGITKEELFEAALLNNPKIFPAQIMPMKDIILKVYRKDLEKSGMNRSMIEHCMETVRQELEGEFPMSVVTNDRQIYGASAILSLEVLKAAAEQCGAGDKMIILPSSIHETICVPVMEHMTKEDLREIVNTVNQTEVSDEDYLSDSVYLCDVRTGNITVWD